MVVGVRPSSDEKVKVPKRHRRSTLARLGLVLFVAVAVACSTAVMEGKNGARSASVLIALRQEPLKLDPPVPLDTMLERANGHWAAASQKAVEAAIAYLQSASSIDAAARAGGTSAERVRAGLSVAPVPTAAIELGIRGLTRDRQVRDALVDELAVWEQQRLARAIASLPAGVLPPPGTHVTYKMAQHASFIGYRHNLPPVIERYSVSAISPAYITVTIEGAIVGAVAGAALAALLMLFEVGYRPLAVGSGVVRDRLRRLGGRWADDLALTSRWSRGGLFVSLPVEIVVAVVVAVGGATAMSAGRSSFVASLVATVVVAAAVLGVLFPAAFMLVLVGVRPLLDTFADRRLHVSHLPSVNLAGGVGIALIVVAVSTLVDARAVVRPAARRAFAFVLVVSVAAALYGLATLHSELGTRPVDEVVRLASLFAMYMLAANVVRTHRGALVVFSAVGLSTVLPAAIGLVQWVRGVPHAADLTIGRISGTFTGPVAFSMYLALGALVLLRSGSSLLPRRWRLVALVVVLAALVGTFSRTGWLMFGIGVLIIAWQRRGRLVLALVVLALAGSFAVPTIRHRLTGGTVTNRISHSGIVPSSYRWRVDTWKGLLRTYSHKPLTGYGLMSTETVNPRKLVVNGVGHGYDAHNLWVKLLVEGGPILLLGYLWLFASLLHRFWQLARARWPLSGGSSVVLLLWGLIAFIGVTTDDPFAATALLLALFALSGAIEGPAAHVVPEAPVDASVGAERARRSRTRLDRAAPRRRRTPPAVH